VLIWRQAAIPGPLVVLGLRAFSGLGLKTQKRERTRGEKKKKDQVGPLKKIKKKV
jgi:hypothetical protein